MQNSKEKFSGSLLPFCFKPIKGKTIFFPGCWICVLAYHRVTQRRHRETQRDRMELNQITEKIIGCAIELPKILGPGLLESAYEECMVFELQNSGLRIERQKPVPVIYKEKN
jgi:hypothetical protein